MGLQVDEVARRTYAEVINGLRVARLDAGVSQDVLASGLPVRGRAVSEWETGAVDPTSENLILWSRELGLRLVLVDRVGELRSVGQRPGEAWVVFERRRLAWPLKARRQAWGMTQTELGGRVGVSRDSIQRWELATVPPRPMSLVVWAQKMECRLDLGMIDLRMLRHEVRRRAEVVRARGRA